MPRPLPSLLIAAVASILLLACGGAAQSPPAAPVGYYPASIPPAAGTALLYRLPVVGTWRVQRTHVGNTRDQAYAFDMYMPNSSGKAYSGDGKRNTDWPAYGQPIVADAPGVIAIAADGIPDNEPGIVNTYDQHGNYVVIDHRNGEFSLMAHLIPGSLRVRLGQSVNTGEELGRCGNSGRTTNPHLHWQVMDNANASIANAILQRYLPYDRNGQMYNGMPDRHDLITAR
jgi:murein DD-endopeptidase MepM/ murein hydrolase activator NlpD